MKSVSILGSTGSIGEQTLQIIRKFPNEFKVHSLSAFKNFSKLADQIREFSPKIVVTGSETGLSSHFKNVQFKIGEEALAEIASDEEIDFVVIATVGISALKPLYSAIKSGKKIGLANKEAIVTAGHLLMPLINECGAEIIPIDSEHNAVFRLLEERKNIQVSSITLSASGGPFLNRPLESFKEITPNEATSHPLWRMGKKISIDSATMMNKGLEIHEAKWLFDLYPRQIKTLIHPECMIHAIVDFIDGEKIGLVGKADMREPISFALFWPNLAPNLEYQTIGSEKISTFSFSNIDFQRYPAFKLALEALENGSPSSAIILNGANEVAVEAFLSGEIRFDQISIIIEKSLSHFPDVVPKSISEVLLIDCEVKVRARALIEDLKQN